MLINMDELKQRLQERQCKLTPQRKIILEVFLNNQDQHLSAEDVHTILRQELSEIGLATVYRTLELLCDMEILHKIDFGDGRSRFEINAGATGEIRLTVNGFRLPRVAVSDNARSASMSDMCEIRIPPTFTPP